MLTVPNRVETSVFTLVLSIMIIFAVCCDGKVVSETDPYKMMVKRMFYDAYDAYMAYAYPSDELKPLTCRGTGPRATEHGVYNLYMGNWSRTLVDALDTLYVIGDWKEFEHALFLVAKTVPDAMDAALTSSKFKRTISLFETTIRVIGGLLSSHMIAVRNSERFSKDRPYQNQLLDAAETVAQRISPAFMTKTGIPCPTIKNDGTWDCIYSTTTVADAGTLILEWRTLSRLTGNPIYSQYVDRVLAALKTIRSPLGLLFERVSWSDLKDVSFAALLFHSKCRFIMIVFSFVCTEG